MCEYRIVTVGWSCSHIPPLTRSGTLGLCSIHVPVPVQTVHWVTSIFTSRPVCDMAVRSQGSCGSLILIMYMECCIYNCT